MDHLDDMDHRRPRGAEGADRHNPWAMHRRSLTTVDRLLLSAVHARGRDPRLAGAARALSRLGEHGALWLAAGLTGAALDGPRRDAWVRGTVLTAGAHLVGMTVKRLVRRPRPEHVEPRVTTLGRHSFPSCHAASATAAAVAFGALGARALTPLATAMCLSRLVAGVHYPSDVAAGAALGALTARAGANWMRRGGGRGHV